jgi:hypothetical protein
MGGRLGAVLGYASSAMAKTFHDLDGSFSGWLAVAPVTADAAGTVIREMRDNPVVPALTVNFTEAGELRGFLMAMGATPAAIAAADEVWARYAAWRRQ